MCYKPIHIRNPSRYFNPSCDSLFIDVPCGHCSECQSNKRNAYYVRSYYEFVDCKKKGGKVLFLTNTYNNKCLPILETPTLKIPCFCKRDVQKFINRVQERLRRKNPNNKVKYFYCSEYGEKKLRPHYHGILYVYANISESEIIKIVQQCWTFGIISGGSRGWFVNDYTALKYASKYVCKDISYFNSRIAENIDSLPLALEKMFRPFHIQSKGFGISALDYLSVDSLSLPVTEDGNIKQYPIPQYLYRKKFMDIQMRPSREKDVLNPTYILNEDGYTNRFRKVRENIMNLHKRFEGRVNLISESNYDEVFSHTPLYSLGYSGFRKYANQLVNHDNFFSFVLFSSTFRNLRSPLSVEYDDLDLSSLQIHLSRKLRSTDYMSYMDYHDKSKIQSKLYAEKTLSSTPRYRRLALFQKIYDIINAYYGSKNQLIFNNKNRLTQMYKQIYECT